MAKLEIQPTQNERTFRDDQVIVSKTDCSGRILYANALFYEIALYTESEAIGQQHSIVRHPDMPRCVFKFAWDRIQSGHEIFAYVKNMSKNGDYYWVFAHMTPTCGADGEIVSYHSSRRTPNRTALAKIEPLYRELLAEEGRHKNRKEGMLSAYDSLLAKLQDLGMDYDEFVFSLPH